ncbi:hypothetical protein GGR28_000262 [Lewinella aquimaris]|uniref:Uncharacterized protein n=1 Tax=Neolewinella aquimaris TaxID=1835722 RepID=A0A840DXE0_9BACT|nr:hypothetical protein [Neolewinella aquimaris]MBB4077661.1 hypothetical protein [Neolewinella aquimaris]
MAQIRIEEKKSGGSILPWIIGLLLLALIIWGVAEAFDESEEVLTEEVVEEDGTVAPVATGIDENNNYNDYGDEAVDKDQMRNGMGNYGEARTSYLDYTANMEGEMGLGHDFSSTALTRLSYAAAALAESKGIDANDPDSKANRARKMADEITRDPMAGSHADKIVTGALLITEILEDVNERAYDGEFDAEVNKLRSEAQAIDGSTLTLEQKSDVRSFFGQARRVLEMME